MIGGPQLWAKTAGLAASVDRKKARSNPLPGLPSREKEQTRTDCCRGKAFTKAGFKFVQTVHDCFRLLNPSRIRTVAHTSPIPSSLTFAPLHIKTPTSRPRHGQRPHDTGRYPAIYRILVSGASTIRAFHFPFGAKTVLLGHQEGERGENARPTRLPARKCRNNAD